MYSLIERCGLLRSDIDVLHFAPERALALRFLELLGQRYLAADIDETRLSRSLPKEAQRIQVDLCRIDSDLAARKFDLIVHSHVMEHLPCSWTIVLLRLQQMLKPGGLQVFSIPMIPGYSREDVSPELSPEKRLEMFGQEDHMRWIGKKTFALDIENIKALTGGSFFDAKSRFTEAEFAQMSGRGHVFALQAPPHN
jgi:hypothetical protein